MFLTDKVETLYNAWSRQVIHEYTTIPHPHPEPHEYQFCVLIHLSWSFVGVFSKSNR